MNRLIITILMLCIGFARTVKAEDTDLSTIDNVIYVTSNSVDAGTNTTLSVCMKNTAPVRGFQFWLYLPEGVTVVKNSKNKIQISLTADRLEEDDDHTISASEQSDGSILILCGSEYQESFLGNDGEIATLQVTAPDNMPMGDYPVVLRMMKLTETDIARFYTADNVRSTLTVKNTATNISSLSTVAGGTIYNLSGQRISRPQKKGLYIQKGKKLIVK